MSKGEEPGWELRKNCLRPSAPGRLGERGWAVNGAADRGGSQEEKQRGRTQHVLIIPQKEPFWLETFSSPTTAWCSKHFITAVNIKCCFITQAYAWNIQWQLTAMNYYYKIAAVKRSWGSGPSSVRLGMNYGLSKSVGTRPDAHSSYGGSLVTFQIVVLLVRMMTKEQADLHASSYLAFFLSAKSTSVF